MSSGLPEIDGVTDLLEIGRGGFGVVYRGIESEFGREVAVKVVMPSIDDRARKRFERERRAMGAVSNHPNIVTVYRGGIAPTGQPYLVMEYLPGGSLTDRLENVGPLDWRAAAGIGAKLADALSVAHRAGILHRDVKPANVFQTENGEPKLGDFGIARLDDGQDSRTGSITASIAHAPPEIVDGERGDERSDLYSLASTVYALTVGAAPFSRDRDTGLASLLSRIANEPPPRLHLESASHDFEAALTQALSKRPDDRQATVLEFGNQLRRAALAPVTQPFPAQPAQLAEPVAVEPVLLPPAAAPTLAAPVPAAAPLAGPAATPAAPVSPTATPKRPVSVGQLGLMAALALLIAGFGGWAVARAAFGSAPESTQPVTSIPVATTPPATAPPATTAPAPTATAAPAPTTAPAPTATAVPPDDPDALPEGFVIISDSTRSISMAVPRAWTTEINDAGDFPIEGGFDAGLSAGGGFLDFSGEAGVRDLTKTGVSVFVSRLDGPADIDGLLDIAIGPWSDCTQGERSELLHPQGTARFQILTCERPDGEFIGAVVFMLEINESPGTYVPIVIQLVEQSEIGFIDVISFLEIDVSVLPDS